MLDFREFCDEVCKKNERVIDNPSLTNLLKEISILFCSKVYTYFFDIHKSMILRYFSICKKVYDFISEVSKKELSIAEKEKVNMLAEGFTITGNWLLRLILEKVVDICDTKFIH